MSEKLFTNGHKQFLGEQVVAANKLLGLDYGAQASELLDKLGGAHMFHIPGENLTEYMSLGHAVTVSHGIGGALSGFVKICPWGVNKEGVVVDGLDAIMGIKSAVVKPLAIEVGSLVVDFNHQGHGIGKSLVRAAVQESKSKYLGIPVMAVVTNDNAASLAVFNKLGWVAVEKDLSCQLLQGVDVLEGWIPPSTIFFHI